MLPVLVERRELGDSRDAASLSEDKGGEKREEPVVPLSWFGPRPRLSTSTSISASSSALVFIVTILVWDRLPVAVPVMVVGGAISNPVFSNIRP